jgi:hypothetical protein
MQLCLFLDIVTEFFVAADVVRRDAKVLFVTEY